MNAAMVDSVTKDTNTDSTEENFEVKRDDPDDENPEYVELVKLLQRAGLQGFTEKMLDDGIDTVDVLQEADDKDLKEMLQGFGMKPGHIAKVKQALKQRRATQDSNLVANDASGSGLNPKQTRMTATSVGYQPDVPPPLPEAPSPPSYSLGQKLDMAMGPHARKENRHGLREVYIPLREVMKNTVTKCKVMECNLPATCGKPMIQLGEKVILVVGVTGAGKSTLIDAMINFIYGVEWTDKFRLRLIEESTVAAGHASQAQSQTDWITAYRLRVHAGSQLVFTLTILDTPGYGNTRGIERDKIITQQLKNFFEDDRGIQSLDAVLFVTEASLAPLTFTQRYVFDAVLSIFGKDVANNICLCFTFADGQPPLTRAAIDEAKIPYADTFKFNNSALFVSEENDGDGSNQIFWNMDVKSLEGFFIKLCMMEPISLQMTQDTLRERDALENAFNSIQPQLTAARAKMEQFKTEAAIVKQMEAQISECKDFKYTIQVPKIVNMGFRIETITVPEEWISKDLEARYNDITEKKMITEQFLKHLDSDIEGMSKMIMSLIDQMRRSKNRLSEIALKPEHLNSIEYTDMMIQAEKADGKPGWKTRVEDLQTLRRKVEFMSKVMQDDFNPMQDDFNPMGEYKKDPDVQSVLTTM